jgi:replicative DNA helicase
MALGGAVSRRRGIQLDREAFDRASEGIGGDDFYVPPRRRIFEAIVRLATRGEAIDLVTVTAELRSAGELAASRGAAYVSELADRAITSANVEYYAGIVRQRALLRRLATVTGEISRRCFEPQPNLGGFLDEVERGVLSVAEKRSRARFIRADSLLPAVFERIETLYGRQDMITGVPTGFLELDRMTAGFQPGNLVIVAGRPSVGKTAFCLNIAEFAAIERGVGVAIFSLDARSRRSRRSSGCPWSRSRSSTANRSGTRVSPASRTSAIRARSRRTPTSSCSSTARPSRTRRGASPSP